MSSNSFLIRRPFVFMRHGETTANRARIYAGSLDAPLTEIGREQAWAAAVKLDRIWCCVVSSQLERARMTAELAVPGQNVRVVPGFNERNWGELEGKPHPQTTDYFIQPVGGESWQVFESRILQALNSVLGACEELPLVVAHSGVYRVLNHVIAGSPDGPRIENAFPVLFSPESDGWKIEPFDCRQPTY